MLYVKWFWFILFVLYFVLFKWMIRSINIVDVFKLKTYFNTFHCRVLGHIFSLGIKLQRKKKLQIYSTWQMTLWILIWIVSDKTFVVIDHKFFTSTRVTFVLLTSFLSFLIGKTFDFFRMCVFPAGEICKMCNRFEKDCYKIKVNISSRFWYSYTIELLLKIVDYLYLSIWN